MIICVIDDVVALYAVHCERRKESVQVVARCIQGHQADWGDWLGLAGTLL